jgi:hypothetical protein
MRRLKWNFDGSLPGIYEWATECGSFTIRGHFTQKGQPRFKVRMWVEDLGGQWINLNFVSLSGAKTYCRNLS